MTTISLTATDLTFYKVIGFASNINAVVNATLGALVYGTEQDLDARAARWAATGAVVHWFGTLSEALVQDLAAALADGERDRLLAQAIDKAWEYAAEFSGE